MKSKKCFRSKGLKLNHVTGSFVEVYFDWENLPAIDLKKTYYLVEIIPESEILTPEYARPNSSGPLHFFLKEGIKYRLNLLSVPYLDFEVHSPLNNSPHVQLIPQHDNLQKLVWEYSDDSASFLSGSLQVFVDGKPGQRINHNAGSEVEIFGRPEIIEVKSDPDKILFQVKTNFPKTKICCSLDFVLEKPPAHLYLSRAIHVSGEWNVRAEIPPFFQMHKYWKEQFLRSYPNADPSAMIAELKFIEDEGSAHKVRLAGFSAKIDSNIVNQIQKSEWKKIPSKVEMYKIQLQITSAHRELFRYVIQEKSFDVNKGNDIAGFTEKETEEAIKNLFHKNSHVSWDSSFVELVFWFKVDGHEWQEFQREVAHGYRWEYFPGKGTKEVRCELVLHDIKNASDKIVLLQSGIEKRVKFNNYVCLRPYHTSQLLACWHLDLHETQETIHSTWGVQFDEIGFYLKVYEEYLGNRNHRSDLDGQIIDLFSNHQNCYLGVEPDKCFSVEIVARYFDQEISLTPVSKSIVTPRKINLDVQQGSPYRSFDRSWFHPSQREVHHFQGKDSKNRSKVMLHLHMHSPNLFRIDPFRESYLKDVKWPIRTQSGEEVHNPPGEWALKNCLDSWLPLLRVFKNLGRDQVDYQVSLDISPPVAHMLSSSLFKDHMSRYLIRVEAHIKGQLALMKSNRDSTDYIWAAERYLADVKAIDLFYNQELQKDMIGAFRDLELKGYLEIQTCTATHGMPAEMEDLSKSLTAQFVFATRSHQRIFGDRPKGIWLAENSFFPGVEKYLSNESLNYFFVESESILMGSHSPAEEEFNPVILPNSGIVAFGRSRFGRVQVWDADIGYAGHPEFREFHFRHLGLPLKRITSKTSNEKVSYNPDRGEWVARKMAHDFYEKLSQKSEELGKKQFQTIPLITCSYDAELFGHHWAEGPVFIEELLREFYRKGDKIGLTTPSHYLTGGPVLPELVPNPSTWGHDAVHVKWSDPKVAWVFNELKKAEGVLESYLDKIKSNNFSEFQKRAVQQMVAELIRSHSSDLPFVIMAGDFEEDMRREIVKYLDYFYRLKHLIDNNIEDSDFLSFREVENDMFPEVFTGY